MQIEVSDFLTEIEVSILVRACDAIIKSKNENQSKIDNINREQIEKSPLVDLLGMFDENMKQRVIENSMKLKTAQDDATHKSIIEIAAKLRKIAKELYDLDL